MYLGSLYVAMAIMLFDWLSSLNVDWVEFTFDSKRHLADGKCFLRGA